jgi:hypothetical protein
MTDSIKGNGILIVVLAIVILLLVVRKANLHPGPKVTVEQQLVDATQTALKFSSTTNEMWTNISQAQRENKVVLTINNGKLAGYTFGQTTIYFQEGKPHCDIVIDVAKTEAAGDEVEPLLAHELKHVWDALFFYDKVDINSSVSKFLAIVDRDKKIIHNSREVELSAIAVEDVARRELLHSGATQFNGMPGSRALADIRFSARKREALIFKD